MFTAQNNLLNVFNLNLNKKNIFAALSLFLTKLRIFNQATSLVPTFKIFRSRLHTSLKLSAGRPRLRLRQPTHCTAETLGFACRPFSEYDQVSEACAG